VNCRSDEVALAVLLFNYMAGVPLEEVPGCKEVLDQESRPILSPEEATARLEEYEKARELEADRLYAELLGCGEEEKDAPVGPVYTPTPPRFPFRTPKKSKGRGSPSTPLSPSMLFGEPTHKKLRGDEEAKDEHKDEGSFGQPTRLQF